MRSIVFVILKPNVHLIVSGSHTIEGSFSHNSLNIVEVDVSTKYNKVYCNTLGRGKYIKVQGYRGGVEGK